MGILSKDIETMQDLFLHQLQDIYYAENQILKALSKMIGKATDGQLKRSFETHLKETETHVSRLERVFELLGQKATKVDCPTINGLIEEANAVSGEVANKQGLDAALISSAQAVEHYEITRYGTLVTWARELGRADIASILHQTLEEEKETDLKLTRLARARLNDAAIREGGRGGDGSGNQLWSMVGDHTPLLAAAVAAGALYMLFGQGKPPARDYSRRSGFPRGVTEYDDAGGARQWSRRYEHSTYPEA
jgi:ferritin-like metal-binding protein YciE